MPKLRWVMQGPHVGHIIVFFDQCHHPLEGNLHFWLYTLESGSIKGTKQIHFVVSSL